MKSVFELTDQGAICRKSRLFVLFAEYWRTQQKPKIAYMMAKQGQRPKQSGS